MQKQLNRLLNRYPNQFLIVQRSDNWQVVVCNPKLNEDGQLCDVETISVDLATPNLDRVPVKPAVMNFCRIAIKEKKVRKRTMYELTMPEAMPKRKMYVVIGDDGSVIAQSLMDGKLNIVERIFVAVTCFPGTRTPMAIDRIDLVGFDETTGNSVKEEIKKPPVGKLLQLAK